jgi:RNA polymerase sigma factor (sigma-70 family)
MGQATDAELCARVLAGDKRAFATMYDRYADRLYDYAHSLLRDRDDAGDAIQETFAVVANRLNQLNDPDRLRPWLYAITRNCAMQIYRDRKREVLEEVDEMPDLGVGPAREAEISEMRDLVWTAAMGLSEKEQSLLTLHLRHGLDGAELGSAMGISANQANVALSRLRDQVEKSLGALLIARLGTSDCFGLKGILDGWDGRFSTIVRKRVVRHVDACAICEDRRKALVSPWALLATVPLVAAPLSLRDAVVGDVQLVALTTTPIYRRRSVLAGAALVVIAVVGALVLLLWPEKVMTPVVALADTDAPQIITQFASATSISEAGCKPDVVTVQAQISENDSIALVEVRWEGPSSAIMKAEDGRWSVTLGPFPESGVFHWQIVATDASGNIGFGDEHTLRIEACGRSDAAAADEDAATAAPAATTRPAPTRTPPTTTTQPTTSGRPLRDPIPDLPLGPAATSPIPG